MEALALTRPAVELEDRYRAVLKENRALDAAAGRTRDGPHLTDLTVTYAAKGIAAHDASTGEQKALLLGLVLANADIIRELTGHAPVLLLDEVMAHLDPGRRITLFDHLERLGSQIWMSGADPATFNDFAARAQVITIAAGKISPMMG
ncbi:MAG: DNA replication and repair protein RecF, partial [Xanthobacteraceae bacterium]